MTTSSIAMAKYHNTGTNAVELKIGGAPGEAPTVYKCAPGQTVEGPENYVTRFERAGLVREDHLHKKTAAEAAKAKATGTPPKGVKIDAPPAHAKPKPPEDNKGG